MLFVSPQPDRLFAEEGPGKLDRHRSSLLDSAGRDFLRDASYEIDRDVHELFARPKSRRCRLRYAKAPASQQQRREVAAECARTPRR